MPSREAVVELVDWYFRGRPGGPPFPVAPDFKLEHLGGYITTYDREEFLASVRRHGDPVRLLACVASDDAAALVVEFDDEVTGLTGREAWMATFGPDAELRHVIKTTGSGSLAPPPPSRWESVTPAEMAELGVRPLQEDQRPSYQRAVRALKDSLPPGRREVQLDESLVLEAADWWFLPHGWIGCAGHLVDKASGKVTQLGSGEPLALYLWAKRRGLLEAPCTLVIDRVHDPLQAARLLKRLRLQTVDSRAPRATGDWLDIGAILASTPARLQTSGLWFALPALREAERTRAFDFHAEPFGFHVERPWNT